MRTLFVLAIISLLVSDCSDPQNKQNNAGNNTGEHPSSRVFSTHVKDSFSIFVSLPTGYNENNKQKYPVVYILDANLYFDIISVIIKNILKLACFFL